MKHGREDYNRIQDPSGKIPEDEPVFLLRGSDPAAAITVRIYSLLAIKAGVAEHHAIGAVRQAEEMDKWCRHLNRGTNKPADL